MAQVAVEGVVTAHQPMIRPVRVVLVSLLNVVEATGLYDSRT